MTFLEKIRIIERMDQLIRMRATGSSTELAKRLNISRSTVYEILELMKNMGAEISYCSASKSFCYERELILAIGYVEPQKIRGGKNLLDFFMGPNFSDDYVFSLAKDMA